MEISFTFVFARGVTIIAMDVAIIARGVTASLLDYALSGLGRVALNGRHILAMGIAHRIEMAIEHYDGRCPSDIATTNITSPERAQYK